jgi:hypothetical protein
VALGKRRRPIGYADLTSTNGITCTYASDSHGCCACGLRVPNVCKSPPSKHSSESQYGAKTRVAALPYGRRRLLKPAGKAIYFYLLVPWRVPQYFICTLRNYPKELEMYALGLSIYNTIPNRTCPSIPFLPCPVPLSSSFRFKP